MTTIFKSIVSCESLGLEESFQGSYFDHVFFKAFTNMQQQTRKCFKTLSIFLLIYSIRFAKIYNLACKV